jgi:hypothetical protein
MIRRHYGVTVDSEVPITGVISNNSACQFIGDEQTKGIDLDWLEHEATCPNEEHDACFLPDSYGTVLIGSWRKDENGLWEPDKWAEKAEFSAIVNEIYTQVVWSKYTRRSALCSPCYVGQGDLDTAGEFLAYDLPPDARDEEHDYSGGESGEKL